MLTLERVSKHYGRPPARLPVLEELSFAVAAGETVAVVGESGAGKSTLTRLVAGLEQPNSGVVEVDGRPPRPRSGRPSPVQLVFQHPLAALNPLWSIGASVGEPLKQLGRAARAAKARELLVEVGVDPDRCGDRPRAFSGGQLQRICVARALAADPRLLICDEPTSALDVSVQAQIMNLLLDKQAERQFAALLVTHDLAVARTLADRVIVLDGGRIAEDSAADAFFAGPGSAVGRRLLELSRPGGASEPAPLAGAR